MIRLIASDMDGTLLDERSEIPPETFELVDELLDLGVYFCISSGRSYTDLAERFSPLSERMDFVASNGCEVVVAGELVDFSGISHGQIMRLAEAVNRFDAAHLMAVVEGEELEYCMDDSPEKYAHKWQTPGHTFPCELGVPPATKPVYNGCIICDDEAQVSDIVYALGLEMGTELTFAWCGGHAVDYFPRSTSKAVGLAEVLRARGVEACDVAAYGDSMNDYDILRAVGHPVVMENALYGIKQIAERIIAPNTEHGVQKDLARLIAEIKAGGQ